MRSTFTLFVVRLHITKQQNTKDKDYTIKPLPGDTGVAKITKEAARENKRQTN